MPQIVVEFVPDYDKVETATDQLVSGGAISKKLGDEYKKAQKSVEDLAAKIQSTGKVTKTDIESLSRAMKQAPKEFVAGFRDGVIKSLKDAGVSTQELQQHFGQLAGAQKNLKQELRELTLRLAELKDQGNDTGEEFNQLVRRAGQIKDAMGDAQAAVKDFASDTQKLDAVIGAVQGVAAAFSIAEGATALFGDTNKDLQETIARVQSTMAVLMGIQQIANLLQKESAVLIGVTKIQRLAGVAAINLESAAQSKNIVIKGAATIAMRLLNATMKANPVLLLVSAFAALGAALVFFTSKADDATKAMTELSDEIDNLQRSQNEFLKEANVENQIALSNARKRGATEEEIFAIKQQNYKRLENSEEKYRNKIKETSNIAFNGVKQELTTLEQVHAAKQRLAKADQGNDSDKAKTASVGKYLDQLEASFEREKELKRNAATESAEFDADRAEKGRAAAEQANEKQRALNEKAAAAARAAAEQRLRDEIYRIDTALQKEKEGTEESLKLSKLKAEAEYKLAAFGSKSNAEKENLYRTYLTNIQRMDEEHNTQSRDKALAAQISTLNTLLTNQELSYSQQEELRVQLITRQAEAEINQAKGNAIRIKEIEANRDREIAQTRLSIRQQSFEQEAALLEANGGGNKRALSAVIDNVKAEADVRINAVNALEQIELSSIRKRKAFADENRSKGLITEAAYQLEVAKLKDQESIIHENTEKKKTDITIAEAERRKAEFMQEVETIANAALQITGAIGGIMQSVFEAQMQGIEERRQLLENEREAGIVSEKQFQERQKRLENEEKRAKTAAARREKAMALFTAAITGAQAIMKAIASAPPPLNIPAIILTSTLVGAQLLAIANKPIPKFGAGTKSAPKGYAEVGETGAEIIRTDNGYYLADHPQIIWMKGGERIFNPRETQEIISATPQPTSAGITGGGSSFNIDYDKLSKGIGDEIKRHPRLNISLDKNGFTTHVEQQLSRTQYRNNRYTFNG